MSSEKIARNQFNLQAANFDSWETPKNREYLQGMTALLSPGPDDWLLDVASGTGDFTVWCGPLVKRSVGIDVSDSLLSLSLQRKNRANLGNVDFHLGSADRLPYGDCSFDIVMCKSAFHHMAHTEAVFSEMVRCCKPGGTIGLCDIIAYDSPEIDAFFEAFERLVDASHAQTLPGGGFEGLFRVHTGTGTSALGGTRQSTAG